MKQTDSGHRYRIRKILLKKETIKNLSGSELQRARGRGTAGWTDDCTLTCEGAASCDDNYCVLPP